MTLLDADVEAVPSIRRSARQGVAEHVSLPELVQHASERRRQRGRVHFEQLTAGAVRDLPQQAWRLMGARGYCTASSVPRPATRRSTVTASCVLPRMVSTWPNLTDASTNEGSAATARRKYFSASTSILAAVLGSAIIPTGARAAARAVSSAEVRRPMRPPPRRPAASRRHGGRVRTARGHYRDVCLVASLWIEGMRGL